MFAMYVWVLVVVIYLGLSLLTATGQKRRLSSWGVAGAAGVVWPITWAVWYLYDKQGFTG